jgi:hypothetical protein
MLLMAGLTTMAGSETLMVSPGAMGFEDRAAPRAYAH